MHFVPSHSVQQTAASAADSVQEAASHGEQMLGPQQASMQAQHAQQEAQHAQQEAQHAQQEAQHAQRGPQQPAQPEQRQTNAKRTFQEILREQLQVCGPCVFDNARGSRSAHASCLVQF